MKSLCLPTVPLGLALVWLGLAVCAFVEAHFGFGLAWLGLGLVWLGLAVCSHFPLHPLGSLVWLG